MTPEELRAFQEKLRTYWKDEKVAGTVSASERGQSGTLFGGGAQNRMDTGQRPVDRDHGGALQPRRAPAAAQHAGEADVRHQDGVRHLARPTRST